MVASERRNVVVIVNDGAFFLDGRRQVHILYVRVVCVCLCVCFGTNANEKRTRTSTTSLLLFRL